MKISYKTKDYCEVLALPRKKHKKPKRINMFFRSLLWLVSRPDLIKTHFEYERCGIEKWGRKEPALVLMNHSSFIDLEILSTLLYPRPFNILTTTDAFIGKEWLMRTIGCVPTKKFIHDTTLLRDMRYCVDKLKSSVVLFPEASYSFDGTATPLPDTVAKLVKLFKLPVIMISTEGAFHRDPLYNNIQVRKVKVKAKEEYLLSPKEAESLSVEEIDRILKEKFSFDNFRWQQENSVRVDEKTRADFLNRVLYKCPHCGVEGKMLGKGEYIGCENCKKSYKLTEYGFLEATDGDGRFTHVPDWYRWEREEVRREIEAGTYSLDVAVDIMVAVDLKTLYKVGEGRLIHNLQGFTLDVCSGKLHFTEKPLSSYSLYSDFNWYEIGDVISIGNQNIQYYCFPKGEGGHDVVAKARLAVEEMYKLISER